MAALNTLSLDTAEGPVDAAVAGTGGEQSAKERTQERKNKKETIFFLSGFILKASEGVHLAHTEEEEDNEEDYFAPVDKYDSSIFDDLCFSNWKKGCCFHRSTSKNRKPKIRPHRKVKVDLMIRATQKTLALSTNHHAQKENIDSKLAKRGIQRIGYAIYDRRAETQATLESHKTVASKQPLKTHVPFRVRRPKQQDHPAALKYELRADNIPKTDVAGDIMRLMIDLQHRDLSPEDYELLLRLDDGVAPKTVSTTVLQSIQIVTVDVAGLIGELCSICMELYEKSHRIKTLPCKHSFHADCIDHWLATSSVNCPLDGLIAC